jgi:hypothetical protein
MSRVLGPVFPLALQFVVEEEARGSGGGGDGRLGLGLRARACGFEACRNGGTRMRVIPYHRRRFLRIRRHRSSNVDIGVIVDSEWASWRGFATVSVGPRQGAGRCQANKVEREG